jgi:hypothetical protein
MPYYTVDGALMMLFEDVSNKLPEMKVQSAIVSYDNGHQKEPGMQILSTDGISLLLTIDSDQKPAQDNCIDQDHVPVRFSSDQVDCDALQRALITAGATKCFDNKAAAIVRRFMKQAVRSSAASATASAG